MDRNEILQQLSAGKINAEQAAQLLRGEGARSGPAQPAQPLNPNRRLRVRVSNLQTGRDRVNVNVPITLVEAGLKLGARYEPKVADFNFNEILEAIHSGAEGKVVDVENYENGERVEIFID